MAGIVLAKPDIGRFVDFEATRVALPRMSGQALAESFEETRVLFEGDEYATPFGGQGVDRGWACLVRYALAEHADMADLLALFRLANASTDRRLMLRANAFTVGDMNAIEVVTVSAFNTAPAGGRAWDVSFTANAVAYTVAV